MTDDNKDAPGDQKPDDKGHSGEDRSGRLVRDLAERSPPKGLDTVTAAADAAEKAQTTAEEREHRIRTRAYELWEREGRPADRPTDFWLQAEAEIAREQDGDHLERPAS